MRDLAPGTILGSYSIIRLIGRGGMGEVYEANEPGLDRRVALKIIAREKIGSKNEPEIIKRFLQEARVLAQVNHPNVVTIHTIDRHVDTHFIAMEYIEGVPFHELFKLLVLSSEQAAPIFLQVLEGMQALHAKNILHRDLKPHNLMLRTDGRVKILDFGIAKREGDEDAGEAKLVGTLPYMAPEVVEGVRANARSDIWSLGAIFYECLVGHTLVSAEDKTLTGRRASVESSVIFPAEALPRIHPEMRAIIARLCESKPEIRYSDLNEAIEDMKAFIQKHTSPPGFSKALCKIVEGFDVIKNGVSSEWIETPASKRALTVALIREVLNGFAAMTTEVEESQTLTGEEDGELVSGSSDSVQSRKALRKQRRKRNKPTRWPTIAAALAIWSVLLIGYWSLDHSWPFLRTAEKPSLQALQPVTLVAPVSGRALWLKPQELPQFKWSRQAAAGELAIEVAADSAFKKTVLNTAVEGNSYQVLQALPEGTYFWRLNRANGAPAADPQTFTVNTVSALDLQRPKGSVQFKIVPPNKSLAVEFNWTCKAGASSYRVQLSKTPNFEKIVKDGVLAFCSENRLPLAAGEYYWRARVESPAIENYPWSETAHFSIEGKEAEPVKIPIAAATPVEKPVVLEKPAPVQAPSPAPAPAHKIARAPKPKLPPPLPVRQAEPVLAAPSPLELKKIFVMKHDTRELASTAKQTSAPQLAWSAVESARSYQVVISRTPDFTDLIYKTVTKTTSLDWKSALPGHYFWRVSAIGEKENSVSLGAQLDVRTPAPVLMSTYSDSPRGFEWETVPLAERYIVQWDNDKSLANKKQKLTVQPQIHFDMSQGPVYVRIATANAKGERTSEFSRVARILALP